MPAGRTRKAFQAALDAAALTKDDAQATIDAAAQTLTETMAALRKRRIKSELESNPERTRSTGSAPVTQQRAMQRLQLQCEPEDPAGGRDPRRRRGQVVVDNAVAQARSKANLVEVSNGGSNASSSNKGSTSREHWQRIRRSGRLSPQARAAGGERLCGFRHDGQLHAEARPGVLPR